MFTMGTIKIFEGYAFITVTFPVRLNWGKSGERN
jgi:hypothetical protein